MAPGQPPKPQCQLQARKRGGLSGVSNSLDSEEVFEHGVEQEEQGERYQFGDKARLRFENAITNYKRSIELGLASESPVTTKRLFDSHFNCARVLVHYSLTFASGRTACVEFIQNGIRHYRESVTLGEDPLDLIDAYFSLSSSLSTLGDMISAGAIPPGPESPGLVDACWEEAKHGLIRTFELQATLSSREAGLHPNQDVQANVHEESLTADGEGIGQGNIHVRECFNVTPSVMIDTLVALVDVLLTLLPTQAIESRDQINYYLAKIVELNTLAESSLAPVSRQFEIENLTINVELSLIENELSGPIINPLPVRLLADTDARIQSIVTRLKDLSNGYNISTLDVQGLIAMANNYSLVCSTYCLTRSRLQLPVDSERLKNLLSNTLLLHSAILSRLRAHRMHPIPHLLPHDTTPLIASSLIGQAEVHLLSHTLTHPHLTAPTPHQHAFGLALEAYNETKAPLLLSPVSLSACPIRLQVVPSPLGERREDWPCLSVRLDAVKMMIRAKWLLVDLGDGTSDEGVEKLVQAEVVPLLQKFGITRMDIMRFREESEGDGVWCMSGGREAHMWNCLLSV